MPGRPAKPCSKCGVLVRDGTARCEKHKAGTGDFDDPARGSSAARGYGYRWQKLRLVILKRDGYLCQECKRLGRLKPARDVDHIIRKADGGTDQPSNLQSLCSPCHDAKSAREMGAGGQKFET